jgi:hypothetical protein
MTTMNERVSDIIWSIITVVVFLAIIAAVVVGIIALVSWIVSHSGQILFIAFLALVFLILL